MASPQPDQHQPVQDAKATTPYIAFFLDILKNLIHFGTRLRDTLPFHTDNPEYRKIARVWATRDVRDILILLQRGILRAMALQKYLQARAARGRDLDITPPQAPAEEADIANVNVDSLAKSRAKSSKTALPRTYPAPRVLIDCDDPMYICVPTPADLEKWLRSGSIGQLLADVCLDLGITPSTTVWDTFKRIRDALRYFNHAEGYSRYNTVQDRRAKRVEDGIYYGRDGWNYKLREGASTQAVMRSLLGFMYGDPIAPPDG